MLALEPDLLLEPVAGHLPPMLPFTVTPPTQLHQTTTSSSELSYKILILGFLAMALMYGEISFFFKGKL